MCSGKLHSNQICSFLPTTGKSGIQYQFCPFYYISVSFNYLISIMFRFEGTFNRYTNVVCLFFGKLCKFNSKFFQVESCHHLI